ncbi:RNA polymerase sigma-70 factor [Bacteroides reticulotermitis]|uniref:RNA polymerase sigma factor n=2 Tax=Bacteroides reticulotermitis TaxID=1133319 RepID=W4UQT0_9BACE|nr:RNA polymerase sigma-70 factor [Bacteroides reticulotermitis]MBB4043497.1 RNA polymerase sigma-70 factor (ECF subfamily) [Bacteroides reticulotermitis]GAE83530.1 RNA polymerase sigma factor [Bacteroides reticulotermitis JCM 10512]
MNKISHLYNFEDIYNQYWEKVYLQCASKLNDTEIAKDLTQDIFRSLWERHEELVITISIEHYLAKATKLKVLEYIRNEAVKRRHNQLLADNSEPITSVTEEELNYKELYERLKFLIGFLPTQCRNVFTLSKIDGLSNKEISSELNISERAVEYHITKAYSFLRKKMKDFKLFLSFFTIFATLVK